MLTDILTYWHTGLLTYWPNNRGNLLGPFPPEGRDPKIELRAETVDKVMQAAEILKNLVGNVSQTCKVIIMFFETGNIEVVHDVIKFSQIDSYALEHITKVTFKKTVFLKVPFTPNDNY